MSALSYRHDTYFKSVVQSYFNNFLAKTKELIAEKASIEAAVATLKDDLSLKSIQEVKTEAKLQALQKDFDIYAGTGTMYRNSKFIYMF